METKWVLIGLPAIAMLIVVSYFSKVVELREEYKKAVQTLYPIDFRQSTRPLKKGCSTQKTRVDFLQFSSNWQVEIAKKPKALSTKIKVDLSKIHDSLVFNSNLKLIPPDIRKLTLSKDKEKISGNLILKPTELLEIGGDLLNDTLMLKNRSLNTFLKLFTYKRQKIKKWNTKWLAHHTKMIRMRGFLLRNHRSVLFHNYQSIKVLQLGRVSYQKEITLHIFEKQEPIAIIVLELNKGTGFRKIDLRCLISSIQKI